MDQLYNSFDPAYKTPFGAVKTGQEVTFRLTIPYDYGFVRPHLVLIRDGGEPVHHAMAFDGCEEGINRFSLVLSFRNHTDFGALTHRNRQNPHCRLCVDFGAVCIQIFNPDL